MNHTEHDRYPPPPPPAATPDQTAPDDASKGNLDLDDDEAQINNQHLEVR
jgi:hypothetical protein